MVTHQDFIQTQKLKAPCVQHIKNKTLKCTTQCEDFTFNGQTLGFYPQI